MTSGELGSHDLGRSMMPVGQILIGMTGNGSRVPLSRVLGRQELEGVPTQPQWQEPQASGGVVQLGSDLRQQPHWKRLHGTRAFSLKSSARGRMQAQVKRTAQIIGQSACSNRIPIPVSRCGFAWGGIKMDQWNFAIAARLSCRALAAATNAAPAITPRMDGNLVTGRGLQAHLRGGAKGETNCFVTTAV
jgi:hypothetical protein